MATTLPVTTTDSAIPIRANPAPKLTKEAIIWISVISGVVALAFIIISILLCGCSRRSKIKTKQTPHDPFNNNSTHRGHRYFGSVSDDRMDHWAYNRSAPRPGDGDGPYAGGGYGNHASASASVSPTSPAPMGKARINERLSHRLKDESWRVAEPVVVEHEVGDAGSPMSYRRSGFGRERESKEDRGSEGRARYYSGWGQGFSKRLSRVSQIGKAF